MAAALQVIEEVMYKAIAVGLFFTIITNILGVSGQPMQCY